MSYTRQTYTNTYSNHTDDTQKRFPLEINWDSNNWNADGTPIGGHLTGNILEELRQHAKAIEAQFDNQVTDPDYSAVEDVDLERGKRVSTDNLYSSGNGLLDGINLMDNDLDIPLPQHGDKIDKNLLTEIRLKLESEQSYSNYSNSNNSGYGQLQNDSYANTYSNFSSSTAYYPRRHSQHNRYWRSLRYSRASWNNYDYGYKDYTRGYYTGYALYGDWATPPLYSDQSYTNGWDAVTTTSGYSVYNRYSDSIEDQTPEATYTDANLPNPGTYQNTL